MAAPKRSTTKCGLARTVYIGRTTYRQAHSSRRAPVTTPIVFNNRMWVIEGTDATTRYNDVWSSTDGINWVLEQAHAAFSPRYTHTVVAFDNAL